IMSEFEVVVLRPKKDEEEVRELFRENFLTREPTIQGLGATPEDLMEFYLPVVQDCLNSDLCLGAKDKSSGELVGVILNKALTPADKTTFEGHWADSSNDKVRAIGNILYHAENDLDIFNKFNVEKVFELGIVTVCEHYLRRGIARLLIERSEQLGRNNGFQMINCQASNSSIQHILKDKGYDTYLTIDFSKNKDVDLSKTGETKGWLMMSLML
ncbi:unnamed protein product, partial [Meganyctiphanes norvegica]